MKIRISLQHCKGHPFIMMNSQYPISAWIYSVLEKASPEFSKALHDKGYIAPNKKQFKLFSFSRLEFTKFYRHNNKALIELKEPECSFEICFYVEESLQHFITGLFQGQQMHIYNKEGINITFDVRQVSMLPKLVTQNNATVKAGTPVVIGKKRNDGSIAYIDPRDENYDELFINNLIDKYLSIHKVMPKEWANTEIQFKPNLANIKSQLIHIKEGQVSETAVRGFLYDFELTAPSELIEVGRYSGWGRMNSLGFGYGVG
jgi:CRISPR-associated endoribonuclease Cas6